MKVTLFKNGYDTNGREFDFSDILGLFSKYKNEIETIRATTDPDPEEQTKKRNKLKMNQPMFCMATFKKGSKQNEDLIGVTGAQLDFDHITDFQYGLLETRFERESYCIFKSPSGDGLKVLVKYDKPVSLTEHGKIWDFLAKKSSAVVAPDPKTRTGGKGCFVSYYPKIFVRPEKVFNTTAFLSQMPKENSATSKTADAPAPVKQKKPLNERIEHVSDAAVEEPLDKMEKIVTTKTGKIKTHKIEKDKKIILKRDEPTKTKCGFATDFTKDLVSEMIADNTKYLAVLIFHYFLSSSYLYKYDAEKKKCTNTINKDRLVQVSREELAKIFNASEGTVTESIKQLIRLKYIAVYKQHSFNVSNKSGVCRTYKILNNHIKR